MRQINQYKQPNMPFAKKKQKMELNLWLDDALLEEQEILQEIGDSD